MKSLKKNQSGFGAMESILIFVIIVIVGALGWVVYKNHNKIANNSTLSNTATTSTTPAALKNTATASKANEMVIRELGITITLTAQLKGLSYTVETFSDGKSLQFTTPSYEASVRACNDASISSKDIIGYYFISLFRKSGKQPSSPNIDTGNPLKQFNGFWVGSSYPNGAACYANNLKEAAQSESTLQTQLQKAVEQAVKSSKLTE